MVLGHNGKGRISVTEEEFEDESVNAKFDFDSKRFRDPRLTNAFLEVEKADGTEITESIDAKEVTYGISVPSDEVKLDLDEVNRQMRVSLPSTFTGKHEYIVSPVENSSDRVEAELREPENGHHRASYISEVKDGQPYIGIKGYTTGNKEGSVVDETERLLNKYGFDEDIIPTQQEMVEELN